MRPKTGMARHSISELEQSIVLPPKTPALAGSMVTVIIVILLAFSNPLGMALIHESPKIGGCIRVSVFNQQVREIKIMPIFSDSDSSVAPSNRVQNSGNHVLVVDDDAEIAESIKLALRNAGFEVTMAHDGNTCIAIAETKHPDLIILDLMMPKRSGFLVLERLRLLQQETIPVIVITGNGGNRHRNYAELLGVDDYIQKPFTMDRLVDSVKNLLPAKTGTDSVSR